MSPADHGAVRELLDRAAIRDVLLRYARGVDRRDLDLVASCFVPGAEYDGALGHGTVETALTALRKSLERYQSTMHFMGNQLIEVAGDTASSETYAVAYHRLLPGEGEPALFVVGVRYLDDLVRAGDGWRISRRTVKMEWQKRDQLYDRADK
jgi:3-phenylpropionate/cinnamic acid dioxygenase small subunit